MTPSLWASLVPHYAGCLLKPGKQMALSHRSKPERKGGVPCIPIPGCSGERSVGPSRVKGSHVGPIAVAQGMVGES